MKPPFSYFGSKMTLAEQIVALMPPHRVYIEPFFGSGAVFFAKPPAPVEIVNDIDHHLINFFAQLRADPDELERLCTLTPHARAEYIAADMDEAGITDLERARRYFVRITQSFANTASISGWKVTTARTQAIPAGLQTRVARFPDVAERLLSTSIECCDAVDLIDRLATADTLLYVDPPYLATTRRRGRGTRVSDYRLDMGDDTDHRRLAAGLRATPATVILSGYPSPLYDELYDDWWTVDFEAIVRASNALTTDRLPRTERLWMNRAPARELTLFA